MVPADADKRLDQMIERCLLFMNCSSWGRHQGSEPLPPDAFDKAVPMLGDTGLVEDLGGSNTLFFKDVTPRDLSRPLDISLITDNESVSGGAVVWRWREIKPKEVRGRVRWVMPTMVQEFCGDIEPNGRGQTTGLIWGRTPSGKWIHCGRDVLVAQQSDSAQLTDRLLSVAYGLAFSHRYQWHVYFAEEGIKQGVEFPIEPHVAYELFQNREKVEYSDRRAALKHWVQEHWRRSSADPEYEVFVRSHLRGRTKFEWCGYRCIITPSDYDINQAKRALSERKEMHAIGKDRRKVS